MARENGLHAALRRTHEDELVRTLQAYGPLPRAELARRVGLSRTTLTEMTAELLARAVLVVVESPLPRTGRGRPAARLALNPAAGQFVGLDFGHRRVRGVVVDATHEVVAGGVRSYDGDSGWQTRVAQGMDLLDELGRDPAVALTGLTAVAVGLPGPFSPRIPGDSGAGTSVSASDLVRRALQDRLGAPVLVDNNTRFAALAEAIWGRGAGAEDLLYVRLSDGVGGGLVIGGRLVTGSAGFAGELGHVSFSTAGARCRCGKRGCLETLASVPSILQRCRDEGAPLTSLADLARAVADHDPVVDRVLRDAGEALGRVLGTVAVALNPAEIVVGGEIVGIAPVLLEQAQRRIAWEMLPLPAVAPTIRPAQLGDDDGALGAVAALFHSSPLLAGYPVLPARRPDEQAPTGPAETEQKRSAS